MAQRQDDCANAHPTIACFLIVKTSRTYSLRSLSFACLYIDSTRKVWRPNAVTHHYYDLIIFSSRCVGLL